MPANYIVFNGESSLDYNVYVSGNQVFNAPEKEYEKVSIPGRSGDLLFSKDRYKNIDINYKIIVLPGKSWAETAAKVREWLLKTDGYVRLEDTYNPNEYRVACFMGPLDFTVHLLTAGEATLTFNCKPQRYLKSGDEEHKIVINASDYPDGKYTITNPTNFISKPRIKVVYSSDTSSSTLVGISFKYSNYIKYEVAYTVPSSSTTDFIIDSDVQYVTNSIDQNCNRLAMIGDFPELRPGETTIEFDGNIESIEIVPRWWRI